MPRKRLVSLLLCSGMLTVSAACNSQIEQSEITGGAQTPTAPTVKAADTTGGWLGKKAPGFSLPDADGKTVDVGKVLGTKPVVLVFYRGVW